MATLPLLARALRHDPSKIDAAEGERRTHFLALALRL
jgi:hypothetical protein